MQYFGLPNFCPNESASRSWYVLGCWSFGRVSSFSKKVSDIIAPKLSIIFKLFRLGPFPECWRSVNATAIHKGAPCENYRPISIIPIQSNVYEKLVSHKLSSFCEIYDVSPAAQFAYRKGLGCTDALLSISHHLQKFLDAGMESYIVQRDFFPAFDRVSHSCVLFKLKYIGVGGSMLSIFTEFLCDRRQRVVVDGAARVSGSVQFQACHWKVCWVLFYLFNIPANRLSWLRTDYLPMQMTPRYWQLFASQQTNLLLLPPLTETWLWFRSGAILVRDTES